MTDADRKTERSSTTSSGPETALSAPTKGAGIGARLASGAVWTIGGYGTAQLIRFATSMALTRLLAPELFGIMLIVNTVRTGVELLSDIGIAQSVIQSPNGEQAAFYRTAWTLQIGRGVLLFAICALLAIPVATIYDVPILAYVLPAAGLTLLVAGFTSMALPILRRRMSFQRLAIFEVSTAVLYSLFQVGVAYFYPTVWALVAGLIFGSIVMALGSYLLADLGHKITIDRTFLREMITFGKWITALSAVYFVTANLDRIYLPSVLTLEILGIFAIARTITDVVVNVFVRLNNSILFPYVASRGEARREDLKREVKVTRIRFLCASAALIGLLAGIADLLVSFLFDARFQAAGWMASLLLIGAWFSILASTAESSLLGLGRPQAATVANSVKLVWLVVSLPLAAGTYGMLAALTVISASDGIRYLATIHEQRRASFTFLWQDCLATTVFLVVLGASAFARHLLGLPFHAGLT